MHKLRIRAINTGSIRNLGKSHINYLAMAGEASPLAC